MSPSISVELLNSEGPVLTLKRISNHWSFTFGRDYVCLITDAREILSFLGGKKPIVHNDKMYLWDSYPDSMKPDPDKLSEFVIELMKEEMEKCKNDKEYFYNMYFTTKK